MGMTGGECPAQGAPSRLSNSRKQKKLFFRKQANQECVQPPQKEEPKRNPTTFVATDQEPHKSYHFVGAVLVAISSWKNINTRAQKREERRSGTSEKFKVYVAEKVAGKQESRFLLVLGRWPKKPNRRLLHDMQQEWCCLPKISS